MQLKYLISLLLIVLKSNVVEHHRPIIANHDTIISISSVLGTRLTFNVKVLNELIDGENPKTIIWYKGIIDLKPLISNSIPLPYSNGLLVNFPVPAQSRYRLVNQTKLNIEQTMIGDEGFYTLRIQTDSNTYAHYLYHVSFILFNTLIHIFQVVLFTQNLSLSIFPSSYQQNTIYHAEQQINLTCSVFLFADHTYIEQSRSLFLSIWYMIIYNNAPDHYQLLSASSNSYMYIAYLFNYELNKNDHNQSVSCTLIQQESQQTVLLNTTRTDLLNIEYRAYLRGNYYFTRSFNAHSSIEINCEEFDANPKAVYTLIWILNEKNHTLLNKTNHGRYLIDNATWRHRGKDFHYSRFILVCSCKECIKINVAVSDTRYK